MQVNPTQELEKICPSCFYINHHPATEIDKEIAPPPFPLWSAPLCIKEFSRLTCEVFNEHDDVGSFQLRNEYPLFASFATREALKKIAKDRAEVDKRHNPLDIVSCVTALTYFVCCKQLYTTMDRREKEDLQTLQGFTHDNCPVPKSLLPSTLILGHIESLYGKIRMRDPVVTFRRWLLRGLQTVGLFDTEHEVEQAHAGRYVWRDWHSLVYIKRCIVEKLKEWTEQPFEIFTNDGVTHRVCLPPIPLSTSGLRHVSPLHPQAKEFPSLMNFYLKVDFNLWKSLTAHYEHLPEGEYGDWTRDVLRVLDLHICSVTDLRLSRYLRDAYKFIRRECIPFFANTIHVVDPVYKTSGSMAQLVERSETCGTAAVPLSAHDALLGYMTSPLRSVEIKPKFEFDGMQEPEALEDIIVQRALALPTN